MSDNKICTKCKLLKTVNSFAKSNSTNDGLQYKCKECDAQYRKENKEHSLEYFKIRYELIKNTPEYIEYTEKYYSTNKEKINERNRVYWRKNYYEGNLKQVQSEYSKTHRDQFNSYSRKWAKNNLDKLAAREAKRRTEKLQRIPKWLTQDQLKEIEEFYIIAKELSWLSEEPLEVDHIIPLNGKNISGLHVPENLQILPESLNRKKSNKYHV